MENKNVTDSAERESNICAACEEDAVNTESTPAEKAEETEPGPSDRQAEDRERQAGESQEAAQEKEHVEGRFSKGRID